MHEDLVRAIIRQLGPSFISLREIIGQGEVNHVFVAETSEGPWVVRFHRDPLDTDDYAKEEWCLTTLAGLGVPVPGFAARGSCEGTAFIVQMFVPGANADGHRPPELWRTLGRYARIINEVTLDDLAPDALFPRFGRDLVANWRQHIAYNLEQLTSGDPLIALGAYSLADQASLRSVFEGLGARVTSFGLTHGDLVPKNVLLPPAGPPVVIDWGSAGAGPAPYSDFIRIWADEANEAFTAADLNAFAEGYGVRLDDLLETMQDLWLLNRIDVVRWAIDHRPDLIDSYSAKAQSAVQSRLAGGG